MRLELLSEDGGIARLAVAGDVTQKTLAAVADPLTGLLGESGYSRSVALDLHSVDTLDSSGVGWLLACQKRFRTAGGTFVLHSLSPFVRDTLKVLKMHLIFRLAEDEKAAVKLLQGPTP